MSWPESNSSPSKLSPTNYKFDDEFTPFKKMRDSEDYLGRLEQRLALLKSAPLNSKSVLQGLKILKDSNHLENNSAGDNSYLNEDSNEVFSLERRLFPSKCLINSEEGQRLLEADILAKITSDLQEQDIEDVKEQDKEVVR